MDFLPLKIPLVHLSPKYKENAKKIHAFSPAPVKISYCIIQ